MIRLVVRQNSVALAALLFLSVGCAKPDFQHRRGQTMGTYYTVQFQSTGTCDIDQAELDGALNAINTIMSTYDNSSELSRLNRIEASEWLTVSAELVEVLAVAAEVWRRSGGAFDVTVGPLVNLWGFGPQDSQTAPTAEQQAQAALLVGMDKIVVDGSRLHKNVAGIYIDLSALAKGYAVDQLAQMLDGRGCARYMVDIGGEIRVAGLNAKQGPWRIGIEVPDSRQLGTLQTVLSLSDISIATSGDYRNFRMVEGARVDHVIDPRAGHPAQNDVVSATVLHPSAMWADAYATTLMVLGMEEGMAFADQEGVAAYMMSRRPSQARDNRDEDIVEARYNPLMRAFLREGK